METILNAGPGSRDRDGVACHQVAVGRGFKLQNDENATLSVACFLIKWMRT
jgi:hypothetical protein